MKRASSRKPIHVLFLPGLGATRRMYDRLLEALASELGPVKIKAYHLDFPEPRAGEELPDFAARLLESAEFKKRDFDFVVGVSFGGMLTQELIAAGLVKTERLVLVSTAFSGRDVARIPALLARLAGVVPPGLHAWIRDRIAIVYPLLRIRHRHARELAGMIREVPAGLLFRASPMILRWRRPLRDAVRRIGAGLAVKNALFVMAGRDPLIRYDRVRVHREPDVFFPRDDHFIAITRTEKIAAAMKAML